MGILDTALRDAIYAGFKDKLLTGIIRQYSEPDSGALDEYGDPIDLAATDTDIQGFVDEYDDRYRAQAGIPEADVLVNIFGGSATAITPAKDDVVRFTRNSVATWYQLRRVKLDPAGVLFTCQAFVIPEPA